jgi:NAD(P)-dependent dehydrogenase (short-subunit alcohol dehydrogenase family)
MAAAASGAVLVTGSSTGIGRATALRLDELGFRVFAGVRKPADGEALEAAAGGQLRHLALDVADAASVEAAAKGLADATGERLIGLVNNAGITVTGPLEGLTVDDWRRQFEVNVFGQVAVTRALLPMLRAAKGRVVFMSSVGGRNALPMLGPYNASKHAIEAIGDSLRQELRSLGVKVSIVEPGSVATPIWDKGQEGASDAREEFGQDVERIYGPMMDRFAKLAMDTGKRGIPPERVADAVEHALTADRPRTRYVVGADAKVQMALRALLPDRVRDAGVGRMLRPRG